MWATTLWNDPMPALQWGVVIGACVVAAMTDLASRQIPNWLTVPLLVGGLLHAFVRGSWAGLADGSAAMLIMATPYLILYFFQLRGGAGDAKLMGAIGTWLGMVNGMVALAFVCAAGVVLALLYAAMHGYARQAIANVRGIACGLVYSVMNRGKVEDSLRAMPPSESMMQMPYGLVIVVGVCVSAAGVLLWRT